MSSVRPEAASTRPHGEPSVPWPGILHDLRGAATAIGSLAGLVADDSPGLSSSSRAVLGLIEARAEQLGALCEAISVLQGRPSGRLPASEVLPSATGRLQKFLDRGAVRLKFVGEIPDSAFESPPLGVLVQSVLIAAVNARDAYAPGSVSIEVEVVNATARIALELAGPGWGPAVGEALAHVVARDRAAASPAIAAAHAALARLQGEATLEPRNGAWRVTFALPVPAPLVLLPGEGA